MKALLTTFENMKAGGAAGEVVTLEGGLKYQGKLVGGVPNG